MLMLMLCVGGKVYRVIEWRVLLYKKVAGSVVVVMVAKLKVKLVQIQTASTTACAAYFLRHRPKRLFTCQTGETRRSYSRLASY